jgi:hypothetical protein
MGLPFNFAGLLEYSNLQKVVGRFSHARTSTPGARATTNLYQKLNSLFGSGLFDSSLLARTELLKGSKGPFSLRDFNLVNILSQQKSNVNKTRLAFSLSQAFRLFKAEGKDLAVFKCTHFISVYAVSRVVTHIWAAPPPAPPPLLCLYTKIKYFLEHTLSFRK